MSRDRSKTRKEAYFVQVESVDKTPYFVDVSADLGKPMKFTKPLATVAMRVSDEAVLFSALKVTTKSRAMLTTGPMTLPLGPLARLERKIESLSEPIAPGTLVVQYEDETRVLNITLDDNGLASLENPLDAEEFVFELPRRQLSLSIFMPGPKGRTLGISWTGFQNKPGSQETLLRAVAYALNHLTTLMEFTILTGIQKVNVPPPPGRFAPIRPALKASDRVVFNVPVRLWSDDVTPTNVASGYVNVEVNLEQASPVTGRLMLDMSPTKELADVFDPYRAVLDNAIQSHMQAKRGPEEITDMCVDITLGSVGPGLIERLRESVEDIRGFDVNPRQSLPFPA